MATVSPAFCLFRIAKIAKNHTTKVRKDTVPIGKTISFNESLSAFRENKDMIGDKAKNNG